MRVEKISNNERRNKIGENLRIDVTKKTKTGVHEEKKLKGKTGSD